MQTFSVAEQYVAASPDEDKPGIDVSFAVDLADTSKVVLTVYGDPIRRFVFQRNGMLERQELVLLSEPEDGAVNEKRNAADAKMVEEARAKLDDPETKPEDRAALERVVDSNAHVLEAPVKTPEPPRRAPKATEMVDG